MLFCYADYCVLVQYVLSNPLPLYLPRILLTIFSLSDMNLGGHHRRSVGSAFQVAFGNIGGIIAVYCFLKTDAPLYTKGYSICIAFTCLSVLSCIAYYVACVSQNRQREKTVRDVGLTEYEKTELGDLNPEYRYLV